MVVAVARPLESGARAVVCASTGNTAASAAAYARARRARRDRPHARPARPRPRSGRRRAPSARGVLEVRGSFDDALRDLPRARRAPRLRARQLAQPGPHRGPEDRRLRAARSSSARRRTSSPCPSAAAATSRAVAAGFAEAGASPRIVVGQAAERATTWPPRSGSPSRPTPTHVAELVAVGPRRGRDAARTRSRDAWHRARARGGRLLRAGVGRRASPRCGTSSSSRAARVVCVLTGHGLKDTAPSTSSRAERPWSTRRSTQSCEVIG